MKRVVFLFFFLLCFGIIKCQNPSLPSWPSNDTQVSIAGSAEYWISYTNLFIYSIHPQIYTSHYGYISWEYNYYDAKSTTEYTWLQGPSTSATYCSSQINNKGILPPPIEIIVGTGFLYNGLTIIENNISVYNWTIQDNFNGYDIFYEKYPSREPFAVYSIALDQLFFFTTFTQTPLSFSSLGIPTDLKCIPYSL